MDALSLHDKLKAYSYISNPAAFRLGLRVAVCLVAAATALYAQNPSGDLRIELIAGYNLVVDSNIESPAGRCPRSAYLGAKFYNDGANDLTNVFAYIGDYKGGTNDTPGIYPSRTHMLLDGPLPGDAFALTHEGGSAGISDATRYIGTIPAGECVTVYWLVSYPLKDDNGDAVWGPSVKPDDDLWLEYDVWARAKDAGTNVSASITSKMTMRNEISAEANKIFPNGANKVPSEYLELMNQYVPSWTNVAYDGSVGTRISVYGIWYDLGNVGQGFDNNGDLVPDHNAWMQPVGDPSLFDASVFRLVKTHAMVIVKLKTGGEEVYIVDDQLYFENIPENNGAVGLVLYEFLPMRAGGSSVMTPYQEVASGYDNEKFNADFGASLGDPLVSGAANVVLSKGVDLAAALPGATVQYTLSYSNASTLALGDPTLGVPLVIQDSVPTGTVYVSGSATNGLTLPEGVPGYTVLYSTNHGASWETSEPANPTNVTDVQWWLDSALGGNAAGTVRLSVKIADPYTSNVPLVANTGGTSIGNTPPFTNSTVTTTVLGTNRLGDTVFFDSGSGGGTFGDGIQNGTEPGMSNVSVRLYYDANNNGVTDSGEPLVATLSTDTNGIYMFTNLFDGSYIAVVDTTDADIPYGYTATTSTWYWVNLDRERTNGTAVVYTNADFGFAPALGLTKSGTNTVREAGFVTYTINITNRFVGNGGVFEYMLWGTNATEIPAASAWEAVTNAVIPPYPDGQYAYVTPNNNSDILNVFGHNIAAQNGNITKVELVIPMLMSGTPANDMIGIYVLTNGITVFSSNKLAAAYSSGTYILDVTSALAWNWSHFSSGNSTAIQVDALKVGGPDAFVLSVDQAGFRITSDQSMSVNSNANTTLSPVPVTDVYDADLLRFVSASVPPTSAPTNGTAPNTIGTLYWDDVGPIYAGGYKSITVAFQAQQLANNATSVVTNVVMVTNAAYASGTPANSATSTVSTTILPAGKIGDFIWRDIDRDGAQDGGAETGIAGVSVRLDPPPGVDVGAGPGIPITNVTDVSGYYYFTGLPADGMYTVTVVTATLPGGSGTNTWDMDGNSNNVTAVFIDYDSTTGGDTVTNADFGYFIDSTIEGTIWHDMNRDGAPTPGSGEDWLTNVTVYLFTSATPGAISAAIATNRTDTNGYFRFVGSYAGTYSVLVFTNSGSMSNGTWVESFDTDGLGTLNYAPATVVTGGSARVDFSYFQMGSYDIGDTLFYDWDDNRSQSTNEEGVANITVRLYQDENNNGVVDPGIDALMGEDVTDSYGKYLFPFLPATNYLVIVDHGDSDFPPRYNITADPYGVNDGRSICVISNASRLDQDFGYQPYGSGSIGDTVWRDLNGDGVQGGMSEIGIGYVTVTLLVDLNNDGIYVVRATNTTDASGRYLFSNLPDGNYKVMVSTNDSDLPKDPFGNFDLLTTPSAYYCTIVSNSYLAADFGFAPLGAIGDTIFWDANRNGSQDWNEDGVSNVTVNLYIDVNTNGLYDSGTDLFVTNRVTDTNGNYLFTGLSTGRYVVAVDQSGPLAGRTCSSDPNADGVPFGPGCDGQYGVRIGYGTYFMGADFGYVPPGVLGDTVWIDSDNDGVRDASEVGIAFVTVQLWSNGVLVTTNETDGDGYYSFSGLPDGVYTVKVWTNDTDFPLGLTQTFDPDGTLDNSGTNLVISGGWITKIGGTSTTNAFDVDFGYRFAGNNVLSGTVGLESPLTYNGTMGTGTNGVGADEAPYSGVSVFLYLWNDDGDQVPEAGETRLLSSAQTSTNGDYSFTGLPNGDGNDLYLVSLSAPEQGLYFTTTNGVVPATVISNTVGADGYNSSAFLGVPVAAAITNMDFAYRGVKQYDYGDLPDVYNTLLQSVPSGARHLVSYTPELYLGTNVDTEANGTPTIDATGDGADENGIDALSVWQSGASGGVVRVAVGKGSGWLLGFMDFANDGNMTGLDDMILDFAASTNVTGLGITTNYFDIPAGAISPSNVTYLYGRFRLSPNRPAFPQFAFSGREDNGEVEDYRFVLGALGDFVWRDTDGDGSHDANEDPIANVRIFVDLNTDGVYQASEPSTLTGTNGWYGIGGFFVGTYRIAVDTNTLPPYMVPTYDLDGTGTAHRASVVMTNGQVRTDVDFGYQGMALGGQVWYDANSNGIQDEAIISGVSNIIVRLYDGNSNWIDSTFTDTNGIYAFDIPSVGNYFVEFFPIGYNISAKDQGGDDYLDSDVSTNAPYRTVHTTIAAGEREMWWDMGLHLPDWNNSLGDRVWFDLDRDGIQDTNEYGVAGVSVSLYDAATNLLRTTITDVEGYYYFANLYPTNYYLRFTKPEAYIFSPRDQGGNDALDSDAYTNTGYTALFAMNSSTNDTRWDCGVYGIVDLVVWKEVNAASPDPGNAIWYTVYVSNSGPAAATGIELTDLWPTNIIYSNSLPSSGSYDSTTRVWSGFGLSSGSVATLVITGIVDQGTGGKAITNTAWVSDLNEVETNKVNNTGSVALVVGSLDLAVYKAVDNPTPYQGSNVAYTIIVTNNGPKNATGVTLYEPLASGLTYSNHYTASGSYDNGTKIWTIGPIPINNSVMLVITARVDVGMGGKAVTNTASLAGLDQYDSISTNNYDSESIIVRGADIGVYKSVNNRTPTTNEVLTYSIIVTNLGPNDTTGVIVYEPLTNGLTYVTNTTSKGTYTYTNGIWAVGSLAVYEGALLTINARVATFMSDKLITNIASKTASDMPDPNPANDKSTNVVTVTDLYISKTSDVVVTVDPSSNITYTIIVTNKGAVTHTNVVVTDPLPAGLSYVAGSTYVSAPYFAEWKWLDQFNSVAYTNSNGNTNWLNAWAVEGVAANVRVAAYGSRTNVLEMETSTNGVLRRANLSVCRSAMLSFEYSHVGLDNASDYVAIYASTNWSTYTEVGRIVGSGTDSPFVTTNINISAFISTNTAIKFVSSGMTVNEVVRLDDIQVLGEQRYRATVQGGAPPSLASGYTLEQYEYLRITYTGTVARPPTMLEITNIAYATSHIIRNPSSARVVDKVARVDIGVQKIVNESRPSTNEIIWFTVYATNLGPHTATGVKITDYWPTNDIIFMSATPDKGTYSTANPTAHVWTIGTLSVNEGASMILTGRVNTVSNFPDYAWITNMVRVTSVNQYDPNPTNDTNSVSVRTFVVLSRVEAFRRGGKAVIEWETASESGTAGFNVYRRTPDGEVQVNGEFVPSVQGELQGGIYGIVDRGAKPGASYSYVIEEIENNGARIRYGPYEIVIPAVSDNGAEPRDMERVARSQPPVIPDPPAPKAPPKKGAIVRYETLDAGGEFKTLKIRVSTNGMYFLDVSGIASAAGVLPADVVSMMNTGTLRLSNRGTAVPYLREGDSGIWLYGEGLDSIYTGENVYWLSEEAGSVMSTADGGLPAPVLAEQSFTNTIHYEQQKYALTAIFTDPESDYWLWEYMSAGSPTIGSRSFRIDVPFLAVPGGAARMDLVLQGATQSGVSNEHHAVVLVNNVQVGETMWTGKTSAPLACSFASSLLVEGSNTLKITAVKDTGVPYSTVYLDWCDLSYPMLYRATNGQAKVLGGGNAVVTVEGFASPDIRVVNVSDPSAPQALAGVTLDGVAGNYRASFVPASATDSYMVFCAGMTAGMAADEASDLRNTNNAAAYCVVAASEFKAAAESLAAYRQGRGLGSKVVMLEDIYDEFNNGIATPWAIRDFLAYAWSNWAIRPRYVALAGEGTHDYRNYRGYGECKLPPIMVATPDGFFAFDGKFCDFNNDNVPEIAVGRLPAKTAGQMADLVNKIIAYEGSATGALWQSSVVLAADNPDGGGDFDASSDEIASVMPGSYGRNKIRLSELGTANTRTNIMDAFNSGAAFVTYFGHGGVDRFAAEGILQNNDVSNMVNGVMAPVVMSISCVMGQYSVPGFDCLGEKLLLHTNGGAIAVWAPAGQSLNEPGTFMARMFYRAVFEQGQAVLGDGLLVALNAYAANQRTRYLLTVYNLLGDPALAISGITPPAQGIAKWKSSMFSPAQLGYESVSGDFADPEGDGIVNLAEYGLALHPAEMNDSRVLFCDHGRRVLGDAPGMKVRFRRNKNASDVRYIVEISKDLANWMEDGELIVLEQVIDDGNGSTETVEYSIDAPESFGRTGYIRLRMARQ